MLSSLSLIQILTEFLLIFSIGSCAGWWLEFFYRAIVRRGDIINPGFLSGPYLPIYGFGAFFLYLAGQLPYPFIARIVIFTAAATLMELFTGLFFVRFYHIRLWDYSDRRGNVKGQICPLFVFYWMLIGGAGLILLVPLLGRIVLYFNRHIHLSFFLGLSYGVILSDVVNSFNIAARLSSVASSLREHGLPRILDYRILGLHLREVQSRISKRTFIGRFLLPFNNISRKDLESSLLSFHERIVERLHEKKAASPEEKQP